MKFAEIDLKSKGAENEFLRLLQQNIHASFGVVKQKTEEFEERKGKTRIFEFNACKDEKIITVDLMLSKNKNLAYHLNLFRLNVKTFYGVPEDIVRKISRKKITLEKMDEWTPILKKFLSHGIVDESIFEKIFNPSVGDDWPQAVPVKKEEMVAAAA